MKKFIALFILAALSLMAAAAWADELPLVYRHQWSLAAHAGGAVRLDLDSQDVAMRVRSGDKVAVTVTIRGDSDDKQKLIERYVPAVKAEGGDIVIRSPRHNDWHWFSFNGRSRALVEVTLPPDMNVHFQLDSGDFDFDGSSDRAPIVGSVDSGDIVIRSAARTLDLNADSGDVRVELSQPAERVQISVDSGDIHVQGGARTLELNDDSGDIVASGPIGDADVNADSGDIYIAGLNGSLHAAADSGDIRARWRELNAGSEIRIRADASDISVTLPAGADVEGLLKTGRGRVSSDFAGEYNSRHTRLELNGKPGAVPVRIKTEGGDIALRKN